MAVTTPTIVMDASDRPTGDAHIIYRPAEVAGDHYIVVPEAPKPPEA